MYVYMTYWQYLIKVGRRRKKERKKIEKYFKSSCLRELKMLVCFDPQSKTFKLKKSFDQIKAKYQFYENIYLGTNNCALFSDCYFFC